MCDLNETEIQMKNLGNNEYIEIQDNSFAAACIEQNSMSELLEASDNTCDPHDMKTWNLTENEWREQIQLAIAYKRQEMDQ